MPFDWQQLVEVARHLEQEASKGQASAEALRRSAIGRAYYGAFCHARNYAVDFLGYNLKGFGDDHGALRAHLKKKRRGGDAQRLDSLRQWRNDADYADDLPWDAKATAAEAIRQAETIFQSLAPPANGSSELRSNANADRLRREIPWRGDFRLAEWASDSILEARRNE